MGDFALRPEDTRVWLAARCDVAEFSGAPSVVRDLAEEHVLVDLKLSDSLPSQVKRQLAFWRMFRFVWRMAPAVHKRIPKISVRR